MRFPVRPIAWGREHLIPLAWGGEKKSIEQFHCTDSSDRECKSMTRQQIHLVLVFIHLFGMGALSQEPSRDRGLQKAEREFARNIKG